ncbi:MAG: hypothetical protein J07HX5_00719 [halophilic archaeon J07HX5]|nr:MAG: hypothetical protein J07HX5_00719 [halophilic archaeon J07HX5]
MTADGWPVKLRGVTETLVTTLGPNDRWNVAALGVHPPATDTDPDLDPSPVPTARTWGRTRTWRNFTERGEGYVQFTRDPELFVEAALAITEREDPVLAASDAWVRVETTATGSGETGGTEWTDWRLDARESAVCREVVPSFSRGYAAVVEATVAASRLDVPEYDTDTLRDRLNYFTDVANRCGDSAEQAALDRIWELVETD